MQMLQTPPCPICTSEHTLPAAELPDDPPVMLYFCMECRSAASPLAPPVRSHSALRWHLQVAERNARYALALFAELGIDRPMVLDIGCGSGTLIAAARDLGGDGVGFDIDADSCAHGRSLGLDLRAEMWSAETDIPAVNLITCIMVLEHMHQPRALLAELIKASVRHACPLFISVPFFDRSWWHYLREPVGEAFHPFAQPRVHVSHFSNDGFEMAARSVGAGQLTAMTRRAGWPGYLIHPPTQNPDCRAD